MTKGRRLDFMNKSGRCGDIDEGSDGSGSISSFRSDDSGIAEERRSLKRQYEKNDDFSMSSDSNERHKSFHEEFDDYGEVVSVGDLTFEEGSIGTGSYATVRLARRIRSHSSSRKHSKEKKASVDSHQLGVNSAKPIECQGLNHSVSYSVPSMVGDFGQMIVRTVSHTFSSMGYSRSNSLQMPPDNPAGESDKKTKENEELVAVKIFSKSILKKMRTLERDNNSRKVHVHTALEKVEREIALMKMMRHPNLVWLHEVIDSEDSDALYMVLDYEPLGEILTADPETGTYRRRHARPGEPKLSGLTPDGHFDEFHAALYFVDIMHGLAYLHQHHICHRDLKPENILLDLRGVAKISDFGVSHHFENEKDRSARKISTSVRNLQDTNSERTMACHLSKQYTDAALDMSGMAQEGLLDKTEGTWCFWAPEMCSNVDSRSFSGYATDIWAAGICLYIFATGKVPFFSQNPIELFQLISEAKVPYKETELSDNLKLLLDKILEKNPSKRAGIGECLRDQFCTEARHNRIWNLRDELQKSTSAKLVVLPEDMRQAFSIAKLTEAAKELLANNPMKRTLVSFEVLSWVSVQASSFSSQSSNLPEETKPNKTDKSNIKTDETTSYTSYYCTIQ